jgi:hypothetical protein
MGASVAAGVPHRARAEVVSETPLARVDWIRTGGRIRTLAAEGRRSWSWEGEVEALASGEYLYLRAVQHDGGAAWSSPFFAD